MERLHQAEEAIEAAEECMEQEREQRKALSKELKGKNMELRDIIMAEKKTLKEKVQSELE
jgi:hypothetical protein